MVLTYLDLLASTREHFPLIRREVTLYHTVVMELELECILLWV